MRIRRATDAGIIKELAVLHKKAFPNFFLTQLGEPFLRTLYQGYLDDADSGIIIAEESGKVLGFIAYSNAYSKFFKELIKHKIVPFAWCSFLAILRHPSFSKRLLSAFTKGASVARTEKYVELASICVDPAMEGRGIGRALIDYLKSAVDFSVYAYISLETDATDNSAVNQFYLKNGFVLEREYTTQQGRRMNEYHYRPASTEP